MRAKSGSTYRRYKSRRDYHNGRIARYHRQERALRYSDYGHWSLSTSYESRGWN